ncbi:hypothetical protein [Metabacillus fastidiosus]|uniref:Transposase n=1 Tax=Metabacillus fastidiosus TaxID=1458 RepID=A0ABU6NUK5_9BACI|nr:hypothetical protein [Metabacillus fastidiosus]
MALYRMKEGTEELFTRAEFIIWNFIKAIKYLSKKTSLLRKSLAL